MLDQRFYLGHDSYLDLYPNWLALEPAAALMQELIRVFTWEHRSITLFGKTVPQPRLIAWAGAVPYRYSGLTLPVRPYPEPLSLVLEQVARTVEVDFNHVLLNRYRNGNDSMGFHSDNEKELGRRPTLASLSLGATRRLLVKPRRKGRTESIELCHGSLLVMGGAIQEHFYHGVPKQPAISQERLNLTFRRIKPSPSR